MNAIFGGLLAVPLVVIVNGSTIQKVKELTKDLGKNE